MNYWPKFDIFYRIVRRYRAIPFTVSENGTENRMSLLDICIFFAFAMTNTWLVSMAYLILSNLYNSNKNQANSLLNKFYFGGYLTQLKVSEFAFLLHQSIKKEGKGGGGIGRGLKNTKWNVTTLEGE